MPVLEEQVKNLEDTLNTLSDYEEIKKVSDALEEKEMFWKKVKCAGWNLAKRWKGNVVYCK